jgi:hypothetical protein
VALYFLVLDSQAFHNDIRPALAASWRQRSFAPCRSLCARLVPAALDFARRYHIDGGEPLLTRVAEGLAFERLFWQHLVGELLWLGAAEIPELQTNMDALASLLAPASQRQDNTARAALPPILQAHHGSRDLVFGGGFYRPEHAGLNDTEDLIRLAAYLDTVQPELWQPDDLAGLTDLPEEEREEELAYVRDWFGPLKELYAQAADRRQVIVCETLE